MDWVHCHTSIITKGLRQNCNEECESCSEIDYQGQFFTFNHERNRGDSAHENMLFIELLYARNDGFKKARLVSR
jgi:hypothetical protein